MKLARCLMRRCFKLVVVIAISGASLPQRPGKKICLWKACQLVIVVNAVIAAILVTPVTIRGRSRLLAVGVTIAIFSRLAKQPTRSGNGSPIKERLDAMWCLETIQQVNANRAQGMKLNEAYARAGILMPTIEGREAWMEVQAEKRAAGVMDIEEAFDIKGRGLVVVGKLRKGITLNLGDKVFVAKHDGNRLQTKVNGYEHGKNGLVGIYLTSLTKADIAKGDILQRAEL